MLFKLILLLTLFPALELYLFIKIGAIIGAVNTVAVVLLTGIAGAFLAKQQGLMTLYKIQNALSKGEVPAEEIVDAFFIFIGGVLLLTPGFLTDFLGLFILIPICRVLVKKQFYAILKKKLNGKSINLNLFNGSDFFK